LFSLGNDTLKTYRIRRYKTPYTLSFYAAKGKGTNSAFDSSKALI